MPQPTQSYYPRALLKIVLRFDEFGDDSHLQKLAPTATTKNLNGTAVTRGPLVAQIDTTAPPGITRYVLAFPGQAPSTGGPLDQETSDDGYTFTVTAIPKSVTWQQNGIKTANTLHATIKYVDCPIDPRLVRFASVGLFLGCVTEDQYAATSPVGPDTVYLPPDYVGPAGETRTNLRFQGVVTKWEDDWGSGEPCIEIEAQDFSQLLHNQEFSPRYVLKMDEPIDKCVAEYLANYVQLAGISILFLPNTDAPPVLSKVLAGTAFRPQLGPQPSKGGGAAQGGKLTLWDYLVDVCGSVALTLRMDGTTLILQEARSLMSGSLQGRADDPFKGRTIDGVSFNYRRYIYGRNIKTMKIGRHYGKKATTNVEIRSWGTEHKKMLVGRFPAQNSATVPGKSDRQVYALPGNTTPDQKWNVQWVPGINDQVTLQKIAQGVYEQTSRQEVSVELKTNNLGSFGGSNIDPDVLDMKVGDTFELLVNRDPDNVNDLTRIEMALTAQGRNAALMVSLGFSQAFADAYAKAYTSAGFTTTFRLKTMKIDWATSSGVTISITGANYIEVRADKFLPAGQETSSSTMGPKT